MPPASSSGVMPMRSTSPSASSSETTTRAGETGSGMFKEDHRGYMIGESPTAGMSAGKKTIALPSVDMTLINDLKKIGKLTDRVAQKQATLLLKARLDEDIQDLARLPLIRIASGANPFGLFDVHDTLSTSLKLISSKLASLSA